MWSSALVVTFLVASALAGEQWQQLKVRWKAPHDNESFYDLPTSEPEAIFSGWISPPESQNDGYLVYCMSGDLRVCTVYNSNGALIALDLSLIVSEVDTGCTSFKWSNPLHKRQVRWYEDVYTTRIWFNSPGTVDSDTISDSGNFGDGLYLTNENIPVTNLTYPQNNYRWQNCVPTMGRHYYYNMSSSLQCEYFKPIFLITNDQTGNLIGFGWQNFGNCSSYSRTWFENISTSAIQATIPQTPTCLTDWVKKCGIVSLHVYLISEPWNQKCGPVA